MARELFIGSEDLKGANKGLAGYAAVAKLFGLTVTSGKRENAITSSGNRSMHADGNAIDVSGPPTGMASFAAYAERTWGTDLEELIYTPLGAKQVKNGAHFVYTGQVAADHEDHVHLGETDPAKHFAAPEKFKDTALITETSADTVKHVVTGPVQAFVDAIAKDGARLLLEIALILGGSILALWGVVQIAGLKPTDAIPAARAAKALA